MAPLAVLISASTDLLLLVLAVSTTVLSICYGAMYLLNKFADDAERRQ
jgi:hypothetical protein